MAELEAQLGSPAASAAEELSALKHSNTELQKELAAAQKHSRTTVSHLKEVEEVGLWP